MKNPFCILLLSIFSLFVAQAQVQDSLFLYKNNQIISKYAVVDIDSITFSHDTSLSKPVISSFAFQKSHNAMLYKDRVCKISGNSISIDMPLINTVMVASFSTDPGNIVTVDGVEQISGKTSNDFANPVTYKVRTKNGNSSEYIVKVDWEIGLPHITITTVNNESIVEKKKYLRAYLVVDGKGFYDNFIDSARIRGRGNSTWSFPKKPYKLKLDKKASIFGFGEEKEWVLLANYLDPVHMLNLTALKAGQLLGVPFTNSAVSVDVTFNGQYLGVYTFTEQIQISKHRVNIDKKEGVLLELDTYFDEDFKFYSPNYKLPVMVKRPKLEKESPEMQTRLFDKIKTDFITLENALFAADFPNNNYKDYIDITSIVKYLIVYNLTDNREIAHPKSTYLHKDKEGKYYMGPIWDFDWAYGYEGTRKHFAVYDAPLLKPIAHTDVGYKFFTRFLEDPEVKNLYKKEWHNFKTNYLPLILEYIDINMINIAPSQKKDNILWNHKVNDYEGLVNGFKVWLQNRASYIDKEIANWK